MSSLAGKVTTFDLCETYLGFRHDLYILSPTCIKEELPGRVVGENTSP